MSPEVSVVVPARNEAASLDVLARRVRETLDDAELSWELILIDDGSTDGSASQIRALSSEDPRVRGRLLAGHQGKSAALACGIHAARGRYVVLMDADLQDLPEEMPVRETFDLLRQVDTTLKIAKGCLFINGIWPRPVSQRDLKPLRLLRDAVRGQDPVVDGALACLRSQVRRRDFQEPYLRELRRKIDMPAVEVPFLFHRTFGRDAVTVLSEHLLKEIERVEAKRRRA